MHDGCTRHQCCRRVRYLHGRKTLLSFKLKSFSRLHSTIRRFFDWSTVVWDARWERCHWKFPTKLALRLHLNTFSAVCDFECTTLATMCAKCNPIRFVTLNQNQAREATRHTCTLHTRNRQQININCCHTFALLIRVSDGAESVTRSAF